MRPGREPLLREREVRDRERLLPEGLLQQHDRERDSRERERMMMIELPPHADPRAQGRGDLRGEARLDLRADYEPLLPREAFSPPEAEKQINSLHLVDEQREPDKADSVDGEKQTRPCR